MTKNFEQYSLYFLNANITLYDERGHFFLASELETEKLANSSKSIYGLYDDCKAEASAITDWYNWMYEEGLIVSDVKTISFTAEESREYYTVTLNNDWAVVLSWIPKITF